METNERVEEQEPWSKLGDCLPQPVLILTSVESERWSGNNLNVELCEVEMVEMADTFESSADNLKRILCRVEENASSVCNGKIIGNSIVACGRNTPFSLIFHLLTNAGCWGTLTQFRETEIEGSSRVVWAALLCLNAPGGAPRGRRR